MPENISISIRKIIIIYNLFHRLNSNVTWRIISMFKVSIKIIIDCASTFNLTIMLSNSCLKVSKSLTKTLHATVVLF